METTDSATWLGYAVDCQSNDDPEKSLPGHFRGGSLCRAVLLGGSTGMTNDVVEYDFLTRRVV